MRTALSLIVGVGACVALAGPAAAQWEAIDRAGVPHKPDGSFDEDAPTPVLPDGKADFSGIWTSLTVNQEGLGTTPRPDLPETDGIPYKPWARDLVVRRNVRQLVDDPGSQCLPIGNVVSMYEIPPIREIIHRPDTITVLYETSGVFSSFRQIFLDGRKLPVDPYPTYHGYSVAHWEGDALVIESNGYNGKTWLDIYGRPSTEQMRMTERWKRTSFGRIEVDVTFDDPGAYDAPWSVHRTLVYRPKGNLVETYCEQNDFDEQLEAGGVKLESVDSKDFIPE